MSDQASLYSASFLYDDGALKDFEALYAKKRETPPGTRIMLALLGGAGAVYFGFMLYKDGMQFTRVGWLLICSVLLVLAFTRSDKRRDDTPAKYRKHYLSRHAAFKFDDEGLEMRLEGQKNYARSKYKDVYGLNETDLCLYFIVKGRAYYILPKDSIADGKADELKKYVEKKCARKFQRYELNQA